jgi:hypothetical protein
VFWSEALSKPSVSTCNQAKGLHALTTLRVIRTDNKLSLHQPAKMVDHEVTRERPGDADFTEFAEFHGNENVVVVATSTSHPPLTTLRVNRSENKFSLHIHVFRVHASRPSNDQQKIVSANIRVFCVICVPVGSRQPGISSERQMTTIKSIRKYPPGWITRIDTDRSAAIWIRSIPYSFFFTFRSA